MYSETEKLFNICEPFSFTLGQLELCRLLSYVKRDIILDRIMAVVSPVSITIDVSRPLEFFLFFFSTHR